MGSGYNKLFVGTIFVIININVGWVDILPNFIGYIIILYGLSILFKNTLIKDFQKAINISSILLIDSLVYKFYQMNVSGNNLLIIIVINKLLILALIYYSLTGSIKLLENHDINFIQRIKERRAVYVYTLLIITSINTFIPNIMSYSQSSINNVIGIIYFIVLVSYTFSLNILKNYFNSKDSKGTYIDTEI
jgi:hypothetical protein